MSILDALPHRCDGYARIRVQDDYGGTTDSYLSVFTDRPCWIQAASDNEIREFEKRGMVVTDKVYFTSKQAMTEQHVLIVDSVQYEVVSKAAPDASVGKGIVWRVMVRAKTTEGDTV